MRGITRLAAIAAALFIGLSGFPAQYASAQMAAVSTVDPSLLKKPAKQVFGAISAPLDMKARAIGSYAKGCLAGGQALPVTGDAWQVMRTSRNRNWAHPAMLSLIERLAEDARARDGWNGLLVGDMAQPRGGPMLNGHASHQVGLDADIWMTPMPDKVLSKDEREKMVPREMVKDRRTLDTAAFGIKQMKLLKRAASYPEVARIFVNPPIKKALCGWAKGDRSWLAKIRPYYGHTFHFHVRINCPKGSPDCQNQPEAKPKDGTGCGDELAYWMGDAPWYYMEHPEKQAKTAPPPMTLAKLPEQCRAVASAP